MEQHSPFNHRPDVDGLRAVAVALVVLYHVGVPGVTAGFVGVDVFFVISGYLITSLLTVEAEQTGRISLAGFYARRVRRLFPALLLVVLATMALGATFLLPVFGEQTNLAKSGIATALYLSNFYFWRYTGNYFDGPAELEPLLHTWSLAVEEQFYLFWPLMVIGVLALSGLTKGRFRRTLFITVCAIVLGSFVINVWQTAGHPRAAYYLMPSRAWELGLGGLLALLLPGRRDSAPLAGHVLGLAGLVAIVASALVFNEHTPFPGFAALAPVLGAVAVIAGGALNSRALSSRLLSVGPMVFVGLLSYSWYLWHWPLLAIARASSLDRADLARDAGLGLLALLAAALTYYLVENPVRRKRPGPFAATPSTLWAGVFISIGIAASAMALAYNARRSSGAESLYASFVAARADTPPLRAKCHHDTPYSGLADRKQCTMGNTEHVSAVLWGDSHADHLSALMQAYVQEHPSTGILQRSFSSCRPLSAEARQLTEITDPCLRFTGDVEREIDSLRSEGLKGVVLSAMWNTVFDYEVAGTTSFAYATLRPRTRSGDKFLIATNLIDATVSKLTARGLRVLIVAPTFIMPQSVPQCLARHSADECAGPRGPIDEERRSALAALHKIAAAHPGQVRIWDPVSFLCDDHACAARRGKIVMFSDDLHFTASGARELLASARASLDWVSGQ
jgi:peptidoglycan/LPS O-acetylase OafA/YrhL